MKIWSSEYLSRLQQRRKWNSKTENLKIDDIVLIKEENLPPSRWLLGRIKETHPGLDGLVRVATIKTAHNIIKRPINKLCRLPFDTEDLPTPPTKEQSLATDTTSATTTITTPASVLSTVPVTTIMNDEYSAGPSETAPKIKRKRSSNVKIYPTSIPVKPPLEELRSTCFPHKQHKKIKTSKAMYPLLLLNCMLTVFASPIEIKPFDHNPGIYMEHISQIHMVNNIWTSVLYYDLATYYEQLNGFGECIEKLKNLCNETTTYKYYCNSILTELQHKVNEMHHNNLILHKRNGNHLLNQRKKRAPLEFIGSLQNSLFGVLDQNYAEYIEGEINKLRENENYLLSLARNQTSIAEVTTNVLKKTTKEIQAQFEVFNNHIASNLQAIKSEVHSNDIIQTFTALTTYTNLIMNNYQIIQKELIDLVLDAHNGKISPFLLNPLQLREQIRHIRGHISSSLIIPGETNSEELLQLYKIITVKSRVMDSIIVFKIQIPLPDEKLFQLFRNFPIPTEHNGEYFYIEPSTEFIATSLHRDLYYPLTQTELSSCIHTSTLGYLCQQKQPIYTLQAPLSRCEMDLLNHRKPKVSVCRLKKTHPSQYWIQLQHPNRWLFVTHEETTINIVCGNEALIRKLHGSGIIQLDPNCQVKHPTMSITAQTKFSNHQRASFLPLSNLSVLLTEAQTNQTIDSQLSPLIHLDTKPLDNIQFNKIAKDLPTINHHHLHHYVVTYTVITILIVAAIWYLRLHINNCIKKEDNPHISFEVQPVTPKPAKRSTATV